MSNDRSPYSVAIITAPVTLAAGIGAAYVGGKFADASARRAADVQLIALAIGILEQKPPQPSRELRAWAVGVLGQHGDVPIPEHARLALMDSVALPRGYVVFSSGPFTHFTSDRVPQESSWVRLLDTSRLRIIRPDTAHKPAR